MAIRSSPVTYDKDAEMSASARSNCCSTMTVSAAISACAVNRTRRPTVDGPSNITTTASVQFPAPVTIADVVRSGCGPQRGTTHRISLGTHQCLSKGMIISRGRTRARLCQLFGKLARHVSPGCCGHRAALHLAS